ncbi:aspartyl-phosphate phosphatase Spo0E family protein [Eubacteriales bacterium mix99]
MELKELETRIQQKRQELNQLISLHMEDLSSDEILRMSNELDGLISAYIDLSEKGTRS